MYHGPMLFIPCTAMSAQHSFSLTGACARPVLHAGCIIQCSNRLAVLYNNRLSLTSRSLYCANACMDVQPAICSFGPPCPGFPLSPHLQEECHAQTCNQSIAACLRCSYARRITEVVISLTIRGSRMSECGAHARSGTRMQVQCAHRTVRTPLHPTRIPLLASCTQALTCFPSRARLSQLWLPDCHQAYWAAILEVLHVCGAHFCAGRRAPRVLVTWPTLHFG